jgi:hypothetical protein
MRYRLCTARSISWLRIGAVATVLALGFASPAGAAGTVKANQKCRAGVGSQLSAVAKTGMASQEKCYGAAAKANVTSEICTYPDSFPFAIIEGGKYLVAQDKAESKLITSAKPQCVAAGAAETLDNYANGDTGDIYPNMSNLLAGSADYIIGTEDLGGDKAKILCQKTIAQARRMISTKMLSAIVKCQKGADKNATLSGFGPLSQACLNTAAPDVTAYTGKITAKCGSLTGDQVGACTPLPDCVEEAALALGRNLALAEYPPHTCEGTATPAGRKVSVSLQAPAGVALGGVDVRVEYPRFQAGVPGNGTETSVLDAITDTPSGTFYNATDHDGVLDVNMAFYPGFSGGHAFDVEMDRCEDFSLGLCSVTTSAECEQSKDCAPHCLEAAYGGTAGNTNVYCLVDSECPPPPSPNPQGLVQQCVCPTCSMKKCLDGTAACLTNQDCNTSTSDNKKRCSLDSHCVGGSKAGQYCAADSTCPGSVCGTACSVDTDCSSIGKGVCIVGDTAGGGFCVSTESCITQTDHCSVSQYLGCGKPTDPACPAGEYCTTQSDLTECTVTGAFDEYANEVRGVTCTLNVTEP